MISYVPTDAELTHILFLRRDIIMKEHELEIARRTLADFHLLISAEHERKLRNKREAA